MAANDRQGRKAGSRLGEARLPGAWCCEKGTTLLRHSKHRRQPETHLEGLHKGRKLAQQPGWAALVSCCAGVAEAKQTMEVPEVAEVQQRLWARLLHQDVTMSVPVFCIRVLRHPVAVCCAAGDACKTHMRWCGCSSAQLSYVTATQAACKYYGLFCAD